MTGFNDERAAIEARLQSNLSGTPIEFENVRFTKPNGSPYVALFIRGGTGNQASIGASRNVHRWPGIIQVDIFVPEDSGTKAAREIADTVSGIFLNESFASGTDGLIRCQTPSYQDFGVTNSYHRGVLTINYRREKRI